LADSGRNKNRPLQSGQGGENVREIKFRAWDKEAKAMRSTYYHTIAFNGQIYAGDMNITDRLELMQFTGVQDNIHNRIKREPQDIYEGDIIEFDVSQKCGPDQQFRGVVEFADGQYVVNEKPWGRISKSALRWVLQMNYGRKVGNIYENLELRK
jgi:hypothetical protein